MPVNGVYSVAFKKLIAPAEMVVSKESTMSREGRGMNTLKHQMPRTVYRGTFF
jgi:hypothetical protein